MTKVTTAVFPVGGFGTRFLPATKAIPKEMLPVVDKPLVQYAVEEAQAAGIDQFVFVTGRNKAAIEDHFDHSYELETELRKRDQSEVLGRMSGFMMRPGQVAYLRQMEPHGLGHAVWCARHVVDSPFAVLLVDDLIQGDPGCLAQLQAVHAERGGNVVALMEVPADMTSRYGIVAVGDDDGTVVSITGLVEKPDPASAPSNLAIVGRYILSPTIFDHLARGRRGAGGEIQLTDAMNELLQAGETFHGVRFSGTRFDCGTKAGFLEANMAYGLADPDIGGDLAKRLAHLLAATH